MLRRVFASPCILVAAGFLACAPGDGADEEPASEHTASAVRLSWKPLPYEDRIEGRNSNAYEPAIGNADPTAFIASIEEAALQVCREHRVPASAIVAMAAVESGYGRTRLAANANNYFSTKVWGKTAPGSWQLKGQPDESVGSEDRTRVLTNLGRDRLIFDEATRADNRYRAFRTPLESFRYLAEAFLKRPDNPRSQKGNYLPAANQWLRAVTADRRSIPAAAKQYLYEIAEAGYCHEGGSYYRNKLGPVMDEHDLYRLDEACLVPTEIPTDLLTIDNLTVFPTVDTDGFTVRGRVHVQVKVTDLGSGVNRVEFYVHRVTHEDDEAKSADVPLTTMTSPTDPIDHRFLAAWDSTKTGPDGDYNVVIQAYDNARDPVTGESAPTFRITTLPVRVKNGIAAPPVSGDYGTCREGSRTGTCVERSTCGGRVVTGVCPGPASVVCCIAD